jgi:hypothetical protein
MAQGGTSPQPTQQTAQPAQQPAGGFNASQYGPQPPQQTSMSQTVQGGQPNFPMLGSQPQTPFGMTNPTFATQQTPFGAPAAPFFGSPVQQSPYAPAPASAPAPAQPDLSTAIGQLKGGNQFDAQNTMRQIVGLPPLQAPTYNANPTMSDVTNLLKSGDRASADAMMRQIVGLPPTGAPTMAPRPPAPAPAPAPVTYGRSMFGRRR